MAWQEERRDAGKQNLFFLFTFFFTFSFLVVSCLSQNIKQKYATVTAYWLWVQAKFLTNLYLKHRKHYFAKEYSIKYSLSNDCLQLGTMHFNCTIS